MCDKDTLLIGFKDFRCIADIATHCNIDRLCPHIREAQETHLANKIGWGLLDALINHLSDEKYQDLVCGSTFQYCGKKHKHFGVKRVLVYYSYGLYKYSNNYIDTPYGTVYKSVDDSVPVDDRIVTKIRDEYFNLANEYWKSVEKYLCANKEKFTELDTCNCSCECGKCEDTLEIGKSRIQKIKTFKKYGNNSNKEQKRQFIHKGCGGTNC